MNLLMVSVNYFFFNDTATTEIYTLSLHDALPILLPVLRAEPAGAAPPGVPHPGPLGSAVAGRHERVEQRAQDRKSTRLNFSHSQISYAVFCLKKKKNITLKPLSDATTSSGAIVLH